jgi:pyrroloquinoline quinone (PQQ) biosynthesis protein C
MTDVRDLIRECARDLERVEVQIHNHPYLATLEAGRIRREDLRLVAGEEYHAVRSDLRSLELMASRFDAAPSGALFRRLLADEHTALDSLLIFARAIGLDEPLLQAHEPAPGTQACPAFVTWLAVHASDAEIAAARLMNFAVWGESCGRIAGALRTQYGMSAAQTAFFDLFAILPSEHEAHVAAVVEAGLRAGADRRRMARAARLLQGYEKLFWDTLLALSRAG